MFYRNIFNLNINFISNIIQKIIPENWKLWINSKLMQSINYNNKFITTFFIIIFLCLIIFKLLNLFISIDLYNDLDNYVTVHNFYKGK